MDKIADRGADAAAAAEAAAAAAAAASPTEAGAPLPALPPPPAEELPITPGVFACYANPLFRKNAGAGPMANPAAAVETPVNPRFRVVRSCSCATCSEDCLHLPFSLSHSLSL